MVKLELRWLDWVIDDSVLTRGEVVVRLFDLY